VPSVEWDDMTTDGQTPREPTVVAQTANAHTHDMFDAFCGLLGCILATGVVCLAIVGKPVPGILEVALGQVIAFYFGRASKA